MEFQVVPSRPVQGLDALFGESHLLSLRPTSLRHVATELKSKATFTGSPCRSQDDFGGRQNTRRCKFHYSRGERFAQSVIGWNFPRRDTPKDGERELATLGTTCGTLVLSMLSPFWFRVRTTKKPGHDTSTKCGGQEVKPNNCPLPKYLVAQPRYMYD